MSDNVIGKKITEYRKQNKMTQQEFADKLFVTNKTVSRWAVITKQHGGRRRLPPAPPFRKTD